MNNDIKTIISDECAGLKIDAGLVKRLHAYQTGFVNKNHDHIEFFGGHLMGVNVVKFMPDDRNRWFDEIMEVDEIPLEDRLNTIEIIDHVHRITASDTMNISCVWLAHSLYTSNIPQAQRHQALVDTMLILQYKFLTSLLFHYFRFPADKATAEATYAELSFKFLIRVHGSWHAMLVARAEEIISDSGIHARVIRKMDDDEDVQKMLNDIQGRIRDMVKNIYGVFLRVHNAGTKFVSTSAVVEYDGEEVLKDRSQNLSAYTRYINSTVTDKDSFMKEELMGVIEKVIHTMPPRLFRQTLEYMSHNYRVKGAGEVEEVLTETLIHSFDYLGHHRELVRRGTDLAELMKRLRGVYMSSRSSDPILLSLREKAEHIATSATGNKNSSTIATIRTGVLLYIVLRAFTMKHYA